MKNLFAIGFFLFALSFAVNAQEETTDQIVEEVEVSGPVMTFENTTVQYGEIDKGSDPLRKVAFTNTGTEPLVITNARGSCGCTVPTWPKEPIMPGESGEIEIRYDTKRVGPINKTVKIKTNEGDAVQHVLYVKGKINNVTPQEGVPASEPSLLAPVK